MSKPGRLKSVVGEQTYSLDPRQMVEKLFHLSEMRGIIHRYLYGLRLTSTNPVKAGLVKRAKDYPYGSASEKYEIDVRPARLLTSAAKAGSF